MSAFDADYQPLYEMYDDEYFPDFLVDKIKAEIDKVETVLTAKPIPPSSKAIWTQ